MFLFFFCSISYVILQAERVQEIRDSDSPYLQFKSSSLGFLSSKLVGKSRAPGKVKNGNNEIICLFCFLVFYF